MNKQYLLLWVLTAIAVINIHAQTPNKQVHGREQIWLGYFSQIRLSSQWGIWTDVHYRRTDDFLSRPFQIVFRPGVTYYFNDNIRINAGYALIKHFLSETRKTIRNEHRPWQQISATQQYIGITVRQHLRMEQRFHEKVVNDIRQPGFNYSSRVRYNFSLLIPLNGKQVIAKTPFGVLTNEVMLNFGKQVVYNTFDQNRLFVGFGYQFSSEFNVQIGYMNVYQQQASGMDYWSTHALRLFLVHSIDLRSNP